MTEPGLAPGESAEPLEADWDSADTVTSVPEEPRATSAKAAPAPHASPNAPVTAGAKPTAATPPGGAPSLSNGMREEVWSIVRAAVDEAVAPYAARQRDLEARLERSDRTSKASSPRPASSPAIPPPAMAPAEAAAVASATPAPAVVAPQALGGATIPDSPSKLPPPVPGRTASVRPVVTATRSSYAPVIMAPPRDGIDLEALAKSSSESFEGFDGSRRKTRNIVIVVVLLLLAVAGLVTSTVLSHT